MSTTLSIPIRVMRAAVVVVLLYCTSSTTAFAAASVASDLDTWLASHSDDAAWIASGSEEQPRAWLELHDNSVVVILKLPERITAQQIVATVLQYDVWRRTNDVETSFQADGAFFTGTKVMGFSSPTVTANRTRYDGNAMQMDWNLMSEEDAAKWLDDHKQLFAQNLKAAGLPHEADDVDDYLEHIRKRLDVVSHVVGSHQFRDGWYRYAQDLRIRSKVVDAAARKLGRARQVEAALKAACYSTGMHGWAGKKGQKGVPFAARGNSGDEVAPGK